MKPPVINPNKPEIGGAGDLFIDFYLVNLNVVVCLVCFRRRTRTGSSLASYLLIGVPKVSFVPLEYLAEPHFPLPRIHHAGVVILQEGLGRRAQLPVDVLTSGDGQNRESLKLLLHITLQKK